MASPERKPSATVTDLAAARRGRAAGTRESAPRKPKRAVGVAKDEKTAGVAAATPARKPANRRFDAEKVERLKAEIAEGRYEIDSTRVADRFIEHERNS